MKQSPVVHPDQTDDSWTAPQLAPASRHRELQIERGRDALPSGRSQRPPVITTPEPCYLNAYVRSDPYANCTVDAAINAADFICFLNKFALAVPSHLSLT
jgi:hypothetical protein